MKQVTIYIALLIICISTQGYAGEVMIENAEGVVIDSGDETADNNSVASSWQEKTQEVLMNALSLTGIPYKFGGTNPNTGFDCSGFVRYVFSKAVDLTLPPTARAIAQVGNTVKKEELQPGDLVFFNTLKSAFSHVGIYIGNNKFIHAPRSGSVVRVENMQEGYWASRFNGAQRLDSEAAQQVMKSKAIKQRQ
jgi:cell wall-associated NlpC family hydrolase